MKRGYAYKSAIDKQTKKALGMTFKEAIEKMFVLDVGN